ncbi:MAG TPA: N-acetyltransferase [Terriglobales bacterium]|nr:N-acetyltransferase [Terriglobales bacterium]
MAQLREYLTSDFEQLWELDQSCFSPEIAYSREELAHYLRSPHAVCLLAVDAGRTVGFILGHNIRQARNLGHIVTLDVAPDARRSGIGSTLIRNLEDRFRLAACESVLLEVAVNNHAALVFYKKHGYSVLKTLRRYYPGGLDGLLLGKEIHRQ